jgi:hypothetical protein
VSRLALIAAAVITAGTVRQALILAAIVRSRSFLRQRPEVPGRPIPGQVPPRFFIVVPVLREAAILEETVAHFASVADGHAADVVLVTTAREAAEAPWHAAADTAGLARRLAAQGRCVHVHSSDPLGLEADQLNRAAASCMGMLPVGMAASQAFAVCYDADSRPPTDSLDRFTAAIDQSPAAGVFHQSSRFEYRGLRQPGHGLQARLREAICDAGALRANRFVLGFEIPRLVNRAAQASAFKRILCGGVYAHVTGHGLCIRLSTLEELPFPARSPLEDMHYSFVLGSRGLPMIPVPSLDTAEVPATVAAQLEQAARWFFGPARALRYLRDPDACRSWRSALMTVSALGSAAEWIGCAVVPALICILLAAGPALVQAAASGFAAICAAQVMLTEAWLGAPGRARVRLARVLAFPLACAVHGSGGILGAARLLTGHTGIGKTERGEGT